VTAAHVRQGAFHGEGLRIGIVAARFNDFIVARLLSGALEALRAHGVRDDDVTVVRVPGALEIALAAKTLAESGRQDAVVCLGCVIRGETTHYDQVAAEVSRGVALAALDSGRPVTFGVITAEDLEQAIDRAGAKSGHKGWDAAVAAIEMASLMRALQAEGADAGGVH
jgi:6,7-dimethyl-8-ribityllumazine synthase